MSRDGRGRRGRSDGAGRANGRDVTIAGLRFSRTELTDFAIAWLALGLAFAMFFAGGARGFLGLATMGGPTLLALALLVSLLTAGIGFLLHELGHKVMAVHYDHVAEFRADQGMLFLAVMSATVGIIFAAPGAVYHRSSSSVSDKENGMIALAGPAVNLALAVVFVPIFVGGMLVNSNLLALLGGRGLGVNLFLAAFNLIPFGSLDGRTVLDWSAIVWAITFLPSAALAVFVVFVLGIGFS